MKIAVFSTKSYDKEYLGKANKKYGFDIAFFEPHLNHEMCKLAYGFEVVCAFVNDRLDKETLSLLSKNGTKLIALRCAGFNNVDLQAASDFGIRIARVPAYSPHGVAEHAVALILALNRKIYRAHNRVHEGNFSIEGLLGFELYGKTVGVLGTGKIGSNMARIMQGFGANVLAYDISQNVECTKLGIQYCSLEELFNQSDIISLHLPLSSQTYHMINKKRIHEMKDGVMIINTSRGGLIDTAAVVEGLKSGKIGYLGLDVYEEEEELFFEDLSSHVIQDDTFARLLTFPNVIVTGHQAFFTQEALTNIAETTLNNIADFQQNKLSSENEVKAEKVKN